MAKLLATAQGDVHVTPEGSRAIEWYYDTDTCEFVADQQQIMSAFHLPHPINGIDDLLKHSRTSQIEEIKQKIVDSETSEEDGFLSCCLMPNPGVLVLVDIRFERLNDHEIRGILIPQVCISGLEDIANILDTVFDLPNVGISVADQNLCIIGCNSAFQYQMGYLRDELIGEKTSFFRSEQHGEEFYEQLWKEIDSKGYWNGSLMSRTKNGSNQVHYHSIYRINFISGQTLYFDFVPISPHRYYGRKLMLARIGGSFLHFYRPEKSLKSN
nr:PAS domain S-box protein [Vibrio alfacsensis]